MHMQPCWTACLDLTSIKFLRPVWLCGAPAGVVAAAGAAAAAVCSVGA